MTEKTNLLQKHRWWLCALLIALLPIWFINYTNTLDWGDDNFQYLHQAKHLFNVDNAGYLVNPQDYGPQKKGLALSLLLGFNTNGSVEGFKNVVVLSYFFFALSLFLFYSSSLSPAIAGLLTICLAFHPFSIGYKNEIVSEFLFTGLLFLILFVLQKKILSPYLIALLFVVLALTRDIGAFIFVCYLVDLLITSGGSFKRRLSYVGMSVLMFFTVYYLCYKLLYPIPAIEEQFYYSVFTTDFIANVKVNATTYLNELITYFEFESPQGFNDGLKVILFLLLVLGIWDGIGKKEFLYVMVFLGYLSILLCYPDQAGARRFLYPIFPFILLFIIRGVQWLFFRMNKTQSSSFACVAVLLVLIALELKTLSIKTSSFELAANDPSVLHDLEAVKNYTGSSDVIGSEKPYHVIYYCERKSFALTKGSLYRIPQGVTYLLLTKEKEPNESLKKQVSDPTSVLDLSHFVLLKTN